jgi:PAS domain S-box-containing protein
MTTFRQFSGSSVFRSLRFRLLLWITGLIVLVLVTFLWTAYRQVETVSAQTAGARAQAAAGYLATALGQGTQQRLQELNRVAASSPVREYLQAPADRTREAARASLLTLAGPRETVVELWNDRGESVLTIANSPQPGQTLPPGAPPSREGIGEFQTTGEIVFSEVVAEVKGTAPAGQGRLGYVVVRRPATAPSGDAYGRLVGTGAAVKIGNKQGAVWVDFTKAVPPPAVDLRHFGVAEYRDGSGRHIGALVDVEGTPWGIWIDFPYAIAAAPAQMFLARMALVALLFVGGTAVTTVILSRRITNPLTHVTEVSEAIAAGAYGRRVDATGADEIVRLAGAFNAMADAVDASHRHLEKRVRERTEELDRFFSLSLDLLCIADGEGRFRRVNPAWQDTLGWTVEDMTSAPYIELVHPDDRAATIGESSKLLHGGVTVKFENRFRCRDGTYRWLSWKAAAFPERGLIYAAARDVTARKEAARELERQAGELQAARAEADRANLAKSEFLSRMSHELRTPLNAVLGFAQVLEMDKLREEQTEAVHQIIRGGKHLLALINEVIDISRIETGRLSLSTETVAVDEVVDSAISLVRPLATERGITVHVNSQGLERAVRADRQRLSQILLNLLANAVKYNKQDGRVVVSCEQVDGDRCRIKVADTGAGIPASKLELLFQPFERLGTERTGVEGTGLGLALSRALAQAMNGTLGVDSVVDRGSTFWVELPLAAVPAEQLTSEIEGHMLAGATTSTQNVVVYIEDNLSNLRLMERILQHRPNVRLVHAGDGGSGVAMVRKWRPSLVLLDMHLPDMQGDEVLRQLWGEQSSRRVPVVVVTADATPGLIRPLQAAGATAHLTKPLDVKQVLQVIDDFLLERQREHEHA